MRGILLLFVVAGGLIAPPAADAETVVGDSLEWLTCKSDLIVVGRIEKIVSTAPAKDERNPAVIHEITFAVTEVVKGKAEKQVVIRFPSHSVQMDAVFASGMRSVEPTLFFLVNQKDGKLGPTPGEFVFSAFDLAHPVPGAFNTQGNSVTTKETILKLCRDIVEKEAEHRKQHPNGRVVEKQIEVSGTLAGKAWYARSAVLMRVPDFVAGEKKEQNAPADDEATRLQGRWRVTSAKHNGDNLLENKDRAGKLFASIDGDEFRFFVEGTETEQGAKFALDPKPNPKQIDFTKVTRDRGWSDQLGWKLFSRYKWVGGETAPADGPAQGIYKRDGDVLTLCWRTTEASDLLPGKKTEKQVRPTVFQSHLYYHQFLFVLERVEPKK